MKSLNNFIQNLRYLQQENIEINLKMQFQGLVDMRYIDEPQIYLNTKKFRKSLQVAETCLLLSNQN